MKKYRVERYKAKAESEGREVQPYGRDRVHSVGTRLSKEEYDHLLQVVKAGGFASTSDCLRTLIVQWNDPLEDQIRQLTELRHALEVMLGTNPVVPVVAKRRKVARGEKPTRKVSGSVSAVA